MEPPIVVLSRGDVILFASANAVETYLEPSHIEDGEYSIYDSLGSLLECKVERISKLWDERETVKLIPLPPDSIHPLELRLELIGFFIYNPQFGEANSSLFSLQLPDLLEKIKTLKGLNYG